MSHLLRARVVSAGARNLARWVFLAVLSIAGCLVFVDAFADTVMLPALKVDD
jgi:hypothetical protein